MLAAAIAVGAYVTKIDIAHRYVIIALPVMTVLTLLAPICPSYAQAAP